MGTLPYTIGFGLILTLMTWFSFNRMAQEVSSTSKSLHAITEARTTFTQQISDSSKETYYSLTGESDEDDIEMPEGDNDQPKKKKTAKKRSSRTTPKLHIRDIFLSEGSPLQETELKIFQNLLRNLYGSLPIFSINGDQTAQILEIFEEVRTTFLSWGDKHRLSRPEHISDISFTGPNAHQKQFILNMILRGGNVEFIIGKRCVLPKLNSYISAIRRKTCMSVYKAPVPILLALFQDPSIVNEVLAYRTEVYKKLTSKKNEKSEEELSLESLSTEFRSAFESKIPSGIDPQYIDFTVTKGKPIDLLRN